jgi:uncharacterized membrane protein
MPFCSQCGNNVREADRFCGRCGATQPVVPGDPPRPVAPRPPADFLAGLSPRTASILCYVPGLGWIFAIIFLAADKFRHHRQVRFHAFQGLYLFVAWLMEDWVLRPMMHLIGHNSLHGLIQAVLLGMSIFMMVKASHDEAYSLPVFGELAQRSAMEN